MRRIDPSWMVIAVLFVCHLLLPPLAVWAAIAAAGPRPDGRIVELLEFTPAGGVLQAQTVRLMSSNSLPADDERAVIVELAGGRLREIPRAAWSIEARAPRNYYRFVTMMPPPNGIAGKRYWIVVR